ncbi:hypothetical protein LCGC14_1563790 [marine sediment metagenome]|uniref:Uncharacterized protein n=1 Tax=marine sediment metagenome TaxID=412755 RepID=A0A0F9J7W6_9ZZZZ
MNVIITQRHSLNKHGDWIDSLENSYIIYFETFGVNLLPVSNTTINLEQLSRSVEIAGIILTGGGDVDPDLYGKNAGSELSISKQRDKLESSLLKLSISQKIPLLGICRGMQFINVFFNGSINQQINKMDTKNTHIVPSIHNVEITDNKIMNILGKKTFFTNSYHNQGIFEGGLGDDLMIFAMNKDLGLIEGIYHKNFPIAGIQWHPERPGSYNKIDEILVEAFINQKLYWELNY